jgi:hypothetical protein
MKKAYERPVLTAEQFDTDDVITVSASVVVEHALGTAHNNFPIDHIPVDFDFNG